MSLKKHASKGIAAEAEVAEIDDTEPTAAKTPAPAPAAGSRPPRVAPAPPPSVRAPEPEPQAPEDDLAGFGPKADAPPPPSPAAPRAPEPAAPGDDMAAMVLQQRPNIGVARPARPAPAVPQSPEEDEPAAHVAEEPVPALDPEVAEKLAAFGAKGADGSPKDPEEEPENPDDIIYQRGVVGAVERMLAASGSPDPEVRAIAKEYVNLLGNTFAPRKQELDARAPEAALDAARRKALEASRGASGGGGLTSMLGSLLGMGRNAPGSKAAAFDQDKEAYARDYNRATEGFRDRLYGHRMAQFRNGLLNVTSEGETLKLSIEHYNEAFLNAPAAAPLMETVDAWMAREGIDLEEATKRLSKDAPPEVARAFADVREDVLSDAGVAAARERMLRQEERFSDAARKVQADSDLLARNFHDKEFDPENARDKFVAGLNEIADQLPDPIAEEESRQKLKERIREMADGIRKAFDVIMEKLVALMARGSAPKF